MTANTTPQETALHLDRIGQIAISVSDLALSKEFYQETLGMRFLFEAGPMALFQCGDIRFMIGTGNENTVAPGGTILYFKVDDIHSAHDALVDKNVYFFSDPHFVARMTDHDLWIAFFKDPDGYTIGLMCELKREETPKGS
jgi:methylmalonyl-CoA/ethylmalonyl-CoA epimerase